MTSSNEVETGIISSYDFTHPVPGKSCFRIDVFKEVYSPREDSFLIMDHLKQMDMSPSPEFMEIGVGTGIISVYAGLMGATVTGTDIHDVSVNNAAHNAEMNGIEACFYHADLFGTIDKKFDIIVFNPPYLPPMDEGRSDMVLEDWEKRCLESDKGGVGTTLRFLNECPSRMHEESLALFLASSYGDMDALENAVLRSFSSKREKIVLMGEEKLFLISMKKE